jgi:hypothetical protein
VPGLHHRKDAFDDGCAFGIGHALVDDPAVALGDRLALLV